jgi:hypothetical protein
MYVSPLFLLMDVTFSEFARLSACPATSTLTSTFLMDSEQYGLLFDTGMTSCTRIRPASKPQIVPLLLRHPRLFFHGPTLARYSRLFFAPSSTPSASMGKPMLFNQE